MAQGRCSAMLAVALLLVSAAVVVNGTTYTVGDSAGWHVPTSTSYYAQWAANHTFVAGDSLLFVYNKAAHNVMNVTSAEYASCTISSTNRLQTGNDSVLLAAGANSFVCGVPGHCGEGQKLTVNATAAPSPSNPLTPPATTPPATTTPATSPPNAATAGTTVTVVQVVAAAMVSVVASLAL